MTEEELVNIVKQLEQRIELLEQACVITEYDKFLMKKITQLEEQVRELNRKLQFVDFEKVM